jgi:hypothetical protein
MEAVMMNTANSHYLRTALRIGLSLLLACALPQLGAHDGIVHDGDGEGGEAPQITNVNDLTVPTDPGLAGAWVTYDPIVISDCEIVSVTCDPPSPHFFPCTGRPAIVIVTAVDCEGLTATTSFVVRIVDSEAPSIASADDITVISDAGAGGAYVNFDTPEVIDNCSIGIVSCNPESGSFFPLGENTVTVTALDRSRNMSTSTFRVIVTEDGGGYAPLELGMHEDVVVGNDAGMSGAIVTFDGPVLLSGSGDIAMSCEPASGSFFPLGSTTVTCTASDSHGQITTTMFMVTVLDSEAPVVHCTVGTAMLKTPNHAMVDVGLNCSATDNAGIASVTVSVSQDEGLTSLGSGKFGPDAMLLTNGNGEVIGLRVRSERDGKGDGRVYLVLMTVTDTSGNVTIGKATISVAKSSSSRDLQSVGAQAAAAMAAGLPLATNSLVGATVGKK